MCDFRSTDVCQNFELRFSNYKVFSQVFSLNRNNFSVVALPVCALERCPSFIAGNSCAMSVFFLSCLLNKLLQLCWWCQSYLLSCLLLSHVFTCPQLLLQAIALHKQLRPPLVSRDCVDACQNGVMITPFWQARLGSLREQFWVIWVRELGQF